MIPVYNVKDYLPKCLDSLLAQNCSDCEILLVDDGSTDGESGAICDRYAAAYPQLIRSIHKPNGGLGDARNVGIEAAAGEYLIFIDSDDYVALTMLDALRSAVAEYHSDIIDFGFAVDSDGVITKRHIDALPTGHIFTLADTPEFLLTEPNAWSRVWKRSLFLETGIRYPSQVWYEDIRTSTKLFAAAKSIVSIPEVFYYYVVRQNSITRNTNVERNAEILDAFDDLLGWYRQQGLFETYYNELSRLAVDHVLIAASVRVLRIDPSAPLLERFQVYIKETFPDYLENPYLRELPRSHKLILSLLRKKRYTTIRALFFLKEKFAF
ncbi:MAG: glycosyltransferase family 2 protein [Oscillospiraceae bacterium]